MQSVIHLSQEHQDNPTIPALEDMTAQATDEVAFRLEAHRILIVDDNLENLRLISRMAQYAGYQTTLAEDGLIALDQLKKARYDVVITDYQMPVMDGFELADQIKEAYFGTKVIVMTGSCEEEVLDMLATSSLIDGLLLKPFKLQDMKENIEKVLHF